jgi:ABC-type molybdate transport system ATPase subunit
MSLSILIVFYLGLLDLEEVSNQCCVNLSMEQKKRVTIGVELAADPSLLFLDGNPFYPLAFRLSPNSTPYPASQSRFFPIPPANFEFYFIK